MNNPAEETLEDMNPDDFMLEGVNYVELVYINSVFIVSSVPIYAELAYINLVFMLNSGVVRGPRVHHESDAEMLCMFQWCVFAPTDSGGQ